MNLNINTKCSVVLTEKGADWLNEYHWKQIDKFRRILEQTHASEDNISRLFPTNLERGNTFECLFWELMEKFGKYFASTTDAPFVNNNINFLIPEC